MDPINLATPVKQLSGVGSTWEAIFQKHGVETVQDLLWNIPYRYIDISRINKIDTLMVGQAAIIWATVDKISFRQTAKRRMRLVEASLEDSTGKFAAVWFNQIYLLKIIKPGDKKIFFGTVKYDFITKKKVLSSPTIYSDQGIYPVYHESGRLSSNIISSIIKRLLLALPLIPEILPRNIIQQEKLLERNVAFHQIHQPESNLLLLRSQHRLAIEELVILILQLRVKLKQDGYAQSIPPNIEAIKNFIAKLTFKLTDGQRKAAWQIIKDMSKPLPMKRLLMGDVGSGKTVVGAIASLNVVSAGAQAIWIAPTDILAQQHFATLSQILKKVGLKVGIYTRTRKEANCQKDNIIVGTHALLQPDVSFGNIGLVVIDEQHRFGVKQRAILFDRNPIPHLLSMTATPIPRTLALTLYGNLDISFLDTLPIDRKPVLTQVFFPHQRDLAYQKIKEEIAKGHQAFIITPLINRDNGDGVTLFDDEKKSAQAEYEKLHSQIFADYQVGLLHGKLSVKDKANVMDKFKNKKLDILVATTVVEVGIDIPNATIIMIENAELFGLAQLHQLRGRVGRGNKQAYCLLMSGSSDNIITSRLQALEKNNNGFKLAEIDLKLRGPGILSGLSQSGFGSLKLANLLDQELMVKARRIADYCIQYGISEELQKYVVKTDKQHGE